MLEALIVYHLVKQNMEIVRARGRNPGGFLTVEFSSTGSCL